MLTDLQIKKLALPEARKEVPDGKVSGLYLVVQPSGSKSWAIRYRVAGQPKKLTLGPYPAIDLATARRRAQEAIGEVAGGKDPAGEKKATRAARKAEREAEDSRLDRIAASYVDRHVRRSVGRTWGKEIERLLRVEILPKLGDKHIGTVRKQHILGLLDDIVDRGSPVAANRTFAVLRQLFNWAIDRDLIETSPMPKGAPSAETRRDRVLSDAEIRMVWRAFDSVGWPIGPIAKLLLLTGARRDEIAEGRWSEIDIESKTWTIAKDRSKNGLAHEIPLSDAAVTILNGMPRIAGNPGFIFTTRGSASVGDSQQQSWQSIVQLARRCRIGHFMTCAGRPLAAWPGLGLPRTSSRPCSTIRVGRSRASRRFTIDTATRPRSAKPSTHGRGD